MEIVYLGKKGSVQLPEPNLIENVLQFVHAPKEEGEIVTLNLFAAICALMDRLIFEGTTQ